MKPTNVLLRDFREDHDATQNDIAKLLGITQQTYSTYETGEIDLPTKHLIKLSKYYGVSCDYLLAQTEYPKRFDSLNGDFVDKLTIGGFLAKLLSLDEGYRHTILQFTEFLVARQKNQI